jgi:hypothetical protein
MKNKTTECFMVVLVLAAAGVQASAADPRSRTQRRCVPQNATWAARKPCERRPGVLWMTFGMTP